ncbi:MAG: GGDEF domain-containing protein [Syntrophobacteraceae bacterium]|nr:GGDEF domain-containing protein [Syntrophobacteraceae bacterium]
MKPSAPGKTLVVHLSAIYDIIDQLALPACLVHDNEVVYANLLYNKSITNADCGTLLDDVDLICSKDIVINNTLFFAHRVRLSPEAILVTLSEKKSSAISVDSLTGLLNRDCFNALFKGMLENARLKSQILSVLFIDLDDFKLVNDTYGHESGDIVLKAVANRMLKVLRNNDRCFRLGGDEFVILLTDVKDKMHTCLVARRLIHAICQAIPLDESYMAKVGASIGIASFPHNGNAMDEILENADDAMYQAKKLGKNNYRLFGQ